MKFDHLKGSIVAMVTPFHEDGSVNFDVLTELLERQIAAGTDGILTLGTTGEYSTMSHEEDAAVVAHTIKVVNGRVPVMVGSELEAGRLTVSVLHSADRWFGMTYHEDRQVVAQELQKLHDAGVYPPSLRA